MEEVDLSGLRDIHLPIKPSWWPPAPGWWLVAGAVLLLCLMILACYLYWATRPKQYATRELKRIYRATQNPVILAREISVLLKRIALLNYPRSQVAALTEEKWVDFLVDKTGQTFSDAQLTLIASSTYMPDEALTPVSRDGLYHSAVRAIQLLFKEKDYGDKNRKPA